jgi:hypothetical protein
MKVFYVRNLIHISQPAEQTNILEKLIKIVSFSTEEFKSWNVQSTNTVLISEYKKHFEVNLHYRNSQCLINSKHAVFKQNNLLKTYTKTSKQTDCGDESIILVGK